MVVRFVEIGGIVDHYCLNFLFLITDINIFLYPLFQSTYKEVQLFYASKKKSSHIFKIVADTEQNVYQELQLYFFSDLGWNQIPSDQIHAYSF